jgi:branched-chain amino acid aminotransferase
VSIVVRVNGRSVGDGPAISALDHGFLYGYGLFETMRALGGRPFLLDRHLRRLAEGADTIGLPLPAPEAFGDEVGAALTESGLDDAYVRLTVTRGVGAPGPDPSTCSRPTVVVIVKPFPRPPRRWSTEGLRAVFSDIARSDSSLLTGVKCANYLECILAKERARELGADEAIFLGTDGDLAEATAWNLFFVEAGRLCTPGAWGPILPGITRAKVIELADSLRLAWEEGAYPPERLFAADEALLTNSLYGVVPLGAVDGRPVGHTVPGPVTQALDAAYQALLEMHRRGDL